MTPCPPQAMKGTTVKSSPDSSASRSPHSSSSSTARLMLPVASLIAATSGRSHSRFTVSGSRSNPVRPGTLYTTRGKPGCARATAR